MITREDELSTLRSLGLTNNQAKILLSLAKSGTCSANTLSRLSQVPREKIYNIMSKLHEMGLVNIELSRPTKFSAVPIKDCLNILIEKKKKDHEKLLKKTSDFIQKIERTNSFDFLREEEKIVLIPKMKQNERLRRNIMKDVQESVDIITTPKRCSKVFSVFGESIISALQRGVKVRVIIEKNEGEDIPVDLDLLKKFKRHSSFYIKCLSIPSKECLAIFDNKTVLFVTFPRKDLLDSSMLWSSNGSLVTLIQNYFEAMWEKAIEYVPHQLQYLSTTG